MDESQLVNIIVNSLQFSAFLVALLFAAQGFAFAQILEHDNTKPLSRGPWIVLIFAFLLACGSLLIVASDYHNLGIALAQRIEVLVFFNDWVSWYWLFYIIIAIAGLLTVLCIAWDRKKGRAT